MEPSNSLLLEEKELESLAVRTEGMTGAGLRRIVADARNLYGYDVAKEQELSPPAAYFEKAIQQLEKHREQLASAPAYTAAFRARVRKGWSNPPSEPRTGLCKKPNGGR